MRKTTWLRAMLIMLSWWTFSPSAATSAEATETATFAAGCFWGTEEFFRKLPGVLETRVGYTGGSAPSSYTEVSTGKTGHAESVEVKFDPEKITYRELLTQFFKMHDPTTPNQQGNDRGSQYRSAVFTHSETQKKEAEQLKAQIERSGAWKKPIVTEIAAAKAFYPAEDYHQKYLVKNPGGYDNHFLRPLQFDVPPRASYSKPAITEIKKRLTPEQYEVTQNSGTEPPFRNKYWDNHADGIYVDVVSGEPLFSSRDKYDSGTGWPSFSRPLVKENLVEKKDLSLFSERTEIRSKHGDSHLGHVFTDGPAPDGLRYCMNSASLRFIPAAELAKQGYGDYASLFKKGLKKPSP